MNTEPHLTEDRHIFELSIISKIAQALNGSVDLHQALQTTLGHVAELLNLETGWIWLLNGETGASYLAAEQNLPPALAQSPARMEGSCYCLDSYRAGDMAGAANINVVSCSRLRNLVDDTGGLTYHASVPLYAHGKQMGVLNVASSDWRELSGDELRLLHTIGDMLGIAVERAGLFERSQELGAVKERNRLAREIHDTLAQGFAAISLQLDAADALLESRAVDSSSQLQTLIGRAMKVAQENLAEARRSVMDLRATPLKGASLSQAMQKLANDLSVEHGLDTKLRATGSDIPLPSAMETSLYRIVQEALTNICNHAGANKANINLAVTPSEVKLTIQDDGSGFDPKLVESDRYGVIGMNERAKLLGGTLELESILKSGTLITVTVPITNSETQ